MKKLKRKGFTLVEIMIVVAIIGLLTAIAIPNFVKARKQALTNACKANLKQIEGSIQVYALDTPAHADADVVAVDDLTPDYLRRWPSCGTAVYPAAAPSAIPACPNVVAQPDHTI